MPARSKRRNLLALLAAAVTATSWGAADASACCLTDWLYGRQPAYAVAPVPVIDGTAPYAAGYTPYTASVAGVYKAGYTPLLTTTGAASTYSVQRPAYGAVPLDNPSVYTGLPVASGYRGLATPGNSFYGTGNMYPNTYGSATPTVTSLRPDLAAPAVATAVPERNFATPIRSGLARFFDSLLGTGYRTSYYTAPITYYRPATTIDPVSGTTVTVQQPCASTVQQIQRTPYATLEPHSVGSAYPSNTLQPCGGTGCASDPSMGYGAAPIASTISPSTIPSTANPSAANQYGGMSGFDANGSVGIGSDYQPLSQPALPPSNYSGRPDLSTTYPSYDSNGQYGSSFSNPSSNLSPLTGMDSFPSSGDDYRFPDQDSTPSASDRQPLRAPELQDARSASPRQDADEAYRQGYEAARAEIEERRESQLQGNYDSYQPETESSQRPPVRSQYQLDPPANSRPSTEPSSNGDPLQRSRYEIERDQRDLRELTTQNENGNGSWPRVRPIPAPENYRNPFAGATAPVSRDVGPPANSPTPSTAPATDSLKAPDLLPALPPPATQFNSNYERPTRFQNQTRLSVPVREASLQGSPSHRTAPEPKANAWRNQVRQQTQESGWYAK